MRTEEKKREKERQSAAPVTPVITTPAENDATPAEPVPEQKQSEEAPIEISETAAPVEMKAVEAANAAPVVDAVADTDASEPAVLANEVWRSINIRVYVQWSNLLSLKQMATPNPTVTRLPMPTQPPLPTQTPSLPPMATGRLEMNWRRRIRPNNPRPT